MSRTDTVKDFGPGIVPTAALFNLDERLAVMCTREEPFIRAIGSTVSDERVRWDEALAVWRFDSSVGTQMKGLVKSHFERVLDLTQTRSWEETRRPLFEHRAELSRATIMALPKDTKLFVDYMSEDVVDLAMDHRLDDRSQQHVHELLSYSSVHVRVIPWNERRGPRRATFHYMLANSPGVMRAVIDRLDTPVCQYQGELVRENDGILYFETENEEALALPLSRINVYQYGGRSIEIAKQYIAFHEDTTYLVLPLKPRMLDSQRPVNKYGLMKFPGYDFYHVLGLPRRLCPAAAEPLVSSLANVLEVSEPNLEGPRRRPRWYEDIHALITDLGIESYVKRYIEQAMSLPPKIKVHYSPSHIDPVMRLVEVALIEPMDPVLSLVISRPECLEHVMGWNRATQLALYVRRLRMLYDVQKRMLSDEHRIDRLVDAVLNDERFGTSAATFRRQLERNAEKADRKWGLERLARWAFETDSISTRRWDAIESLTRAFAEFWSRRTDTAIREGLIDREARKPGTAEELIAAIERHNGLSHGQ